MILTASNAYIVFTYPILLEILKSPNFLDIVCSFLMGPLGRFVNVDSNSQEFRPRVKKLTSFTSLKSEELLTNEISDIGKCERKYFYSFYRGRVILIFA